MTDIFDHPGYIRPNRIWEEVGICACGDCRFHKPRKCPVIAQYESSKTLQPKIERVTLYASRPRR